MVSLHGPEIYFSNEQNLNGTPGTPGTMGFLQEKWLNSPENGQNQGSITKLGGNAQRIAKNCGSTSQFAQGCVENIGSHPQLCFSISLRVYPTREANPVQKRVCHGRPGSRTDWIPGPTRLSRTTRELGKLIAAQKLASWNMVKIHGFSIS